MGFNSSNNSSSGAGFGSNTAIGGGMNMNYGTNQSGNYGQNQSSGGSQNVSQNTSQSTQDVYGAQSPYLQDVYAQAQNAFSQGMGDVNGMRPMVQGSMGNLQNIQSGAMNMFNPSMLGQQMAANYAQTIGGPTVLGNSFSQGTSMGNSFNNSSGFNTGFSNGMNVGMGGNMNVGYGNNYNSSNGQGSSTGVQIPI